MGSKMPPTKPPSIDPEKDVVTALPSSSGHAFARSSLQRIAGALQVPLDTLYQLPRVVDGAPQLDGEAADAADCAAECATLIQAFMRITDRAERSRIIALVRAAADQA